MGDGATFAAFLGSAVAISLSGVMAPGPMMAVTLGLGTRNRHAGVWLAVGHAVVEVPLMLAIVAGGGYALKHSAVRGGVGLAGGAMLLWMGVGLLGEARRPRELDPADPPRRSPLVSGIVMTGANPYFLLWWATIGLGLVTQAAGFGPWAFAVFAAVHWVCDLVWLEVLSQASYRGRGLLDARLWRAALVVCGVSLLGFGGKFLYDGGITLWTGA